MTGPQNYKEAERLIDLGVDLAKRGLTTQSEAAVALAQVHATLAVAAATALPASVRYYGDESNADRAWAAIV